VTSFAVDKPQDDIAWARVVRIPYPSCELWLGSLFMADLFGKLVVRPHAPRRRAVIVAVAATLGLVALYIAFEMGRRDAGYRMFDSARGAISASERIRDLEAENARQREQLEAADVARRVDREGYKQVERSLGDMQSQIARLTQDLSFYRGLVQPDSLVHVKVQQMQIVPEATPGLFRLKFVLMQTGKPEREVTGNVALAIDGLIHGKPLNLSFYQVSPSHHGGLAYSFRYFQDYDEPVQLPPGFEPTRIEIEVHSGKDGGHGFQQAFVWKAQGMSLETDTADKSTGRKGGVDVQA
jgi:hypothetical protein